MSNTLLQLYDLSKKYGNLTAVNKLSLTIEKGKVYGLLDPTEAVNQLLWEWY